MREAKRILTLLGLLFILLSPAAGLSAQGWLERAQEGGLNEIGSEAYNEDGEPERSLPAIVASLVKVFLGFLGIIFVVLLIFAGFKYMTAAGNQDKVEEAVKQIRNAVIGLIIVAAAYSITYFITERVIPQVTNS